MIVSFPWFYGNNISSSSFFQYFTDSSLGWREIYWDFDPKDFSYQTYEVCNRRGLDQYDLFPIVDGTGNCDYFQGFDYVLGAQTSLFLILL